MATEPPRRRVIKKISGGHAHHGGAWKVAYADFVTAMMALFMVLWLLASSDQQTRKEISDYFRTGILPEGDLAMNRAAQFAPSVIEAAPTPPPPGEESIDTTVSKIKDSLTRMAAIDTELAEVIRNVNVKVTEDGILIETVDEDRGLLFDLSSARLTPRLERFLRGLAPMIANVKAPVEINGHTDARPFARGAGMSNWDLSYQRAAAAREILEANGLPPGQIAGVIGRGACEPYTPADPYGAQNRRLSILIKTPKASRRGGLAAGSPIRPPISLGAIARDGDTSASPVRNLP